MEQRVWIVRWKPADSEDDFYIPGDIEIFTTKKLASEHADSLFRNKEYVDSSSIMISWSYVWDGSSYPMGKREYLTEEDYDE